MRRSRNAKLYEFSLRLRRHVLAPSRERYFSSPLETSKYVNVVDNVYAHDHGVAGRVLCLANEGNVSSLRGMNRDSTSLRFASPSRLLRNDDLSPPFLHFRDLEPPCLPRFHDINRMPMIPTFLSLRSSSFAPHLICSVLHLVRYLLFSSRYSSSLFFSLSFATDIFLISFAFRSLRIYFKTPW